MFMRSLFSISDCLCGEYTFTDIWDKMVDDNSLETVFYDGKLEGPSELEKLLTSSECRTYFCYYDAELIGLVWLTHFDYCTARIHFALFHEGKYRMIAGARVLLNFLLKQYKCLIGWIPEWNRAALKFIKHSGFRYAGEIPDVAYSRNSNSYSNMFIFYIQGDF